jgi:FAD/FMN-containing dehydrogenase/Fe-S oxidoreductase
MIDHQPAHLPHPQVGAFAKSSMPLTVLNNLDSYRVDQAQREQIQAALRGKVAGDVRFGKHDRLLYATDASMYQVEPIGVVIPVDEADTVAAIEVCDELGVAMLPRGGGTSLAGQCTNHAVVIDTSANLRLMGHVERDGSGQASMWVGAGAVPDEINLHLSKLGEKLFFAPDPATVAQASIGGCIGNNASGSRSIKYGRTVDTIAQIEIATVTGHRCVLGPGAGRGDVVALKLAEGVARIVRKYESHIRERFPKTLRRNAGYALDLILQQLDQGIEPRDLDLTKLLCGSEGTLAVTLGARIKLFKTPGAKGLLLMSFASVDEAIAVVPALIATGPSAVELVDDVVIEAALNNIECRAYVAAFPKLTSPDGSQRLPAATLYVEYHEGDRAAIEAKFEQARAAATAIIPGAVSRPVLDAAGMADAWKLRKAGEPLLHGLPGHRKPITFVEDNAVPPENLARFVREFRAIVEREGTRAAFWAHASVGVLHVRPMIDPHDEADLDRLKRIAVEVADLARDCGGVMSGEHGDGKVRGPLLERYYGPEVMQAFREVKALFDPKNLLNPGNIVQPGSIDTIVERTRIDPMRGVIADAKVAPTIPEQSTYYRYDDHEGFAHAVERCNGAGVCRKQSGGTMCPSYRGTMDERHSTRGRGNALRLAITGQMHDEFGKPTWNDAQTIATLDLCLSCKACKSECPSNVDIARLKAEYTAQRYKQLGRVPLKAWLIGSIRRLNRLGSIMPAMSNAANKSAFARRIINRVMNVHPQRTLPPFSQSLYAIWGKDALQDAAQTRTVALFADCFSTYNESHLGLALKRSLTALGYNTKLPSHGCCGRSMMSVGMLQQAIDVIDRTIEELRGVIEDDSVEAILFLEPSCLSAIKDDWLTLRCNSPLALRQKLAAKSYLAEDWIERHWQSHPRHAQAQIALSNYAQRSEQTPIVLHAHCHQKALWGGATSSKLLKRLVGDRLLTPDTGCCGMAGSFGYDADKYELSMRVANLPNGGIMPHLKPDASGRTPRVCATGTSCRHQIKDASQGRLHAQHPIELLDEMLRGVAANQ